MVVESRYKPLKTQYNQLKNKGFDYRGKILTRFLDNNMFKNPILRGFLIKVERKVTFWFTETRKIKLFRQIAIDKDDEEINL